MTEQKVDYSKDRVLFVDDEVNILHSLERFLLHEPYQQRFVDSGQKALELLRQESFQVVVSDLRMPVMDGLTLLRTVKEEHPDILRMVLTGYTQVPQILATINSGEIYRYLTKPLNQPEEIITTLRQALDYQRLRRDRLELVENLEKRNTELEAALAEIKQLRGLLPICAYCKRVRDDKGYWEQIEAYVQKNSDASFSHGICPDCMRKHYPEIAKDMYGEKNGPDAEPGDVMS
ncbi:MAG: response regulator [Spartobacteria bacterium]|nr:response regulator [Spartobacteria bacterium]